MKKSIALCLAMIASLAVAPAAESTTSTLIGLTCGRGPSAANSATASGTYGGVAFTVSCTKTHDGTTTVSNPTSQVYTVHTDYSTNSGSFACDQSGDGLAVPSWMALTSACGPTQTTFYR